MATTEQAVEQFLASLRARQAPANTIKAYSHDLRHFLAAVPMLLAEVTAPLIEAFLQGDGHHSVATQPGFHATTLSCASRRGNPSTFPLKIKVQGASLPIAGYSGEASR
jgi:hypothetical protein